MEYLIIAIIGILFLVKASDIFVDQIIALSKRYKISGFIVGFTVLAFGTSLPELVTSTYSTFSGHPQIAISNVIGSNIVNLCLILGILAIFKTYKLSKTDVKYNIPQNLIAISLFGVLCFAFNFQLFGFDGIILLVIFTIFILMSKRENHDIKVKSTIKFNLLILIISFLVLIVAGKISIDELVKFSGLFGIRESLLGYFIVAIGTSLPELVTSYMAVKKGNAELGIGNILGSNLFNLFFILGISAFINTIYIQEFLPELVFLAVATFSVLVFALTGKKYYFSKIEGFGLLILYTIFILIQINK